MFSLKHITVFGLVAFRWDYSIYSCFEKGCRKNAHAAIPSGNLGYDQYTVPDIVAVETNAQKSSKQFKPGMNNVAVLGLISQNYGFSM